VFRRVLEGERSAGETVLTGPLRKWNSHQRTQLFENINYTPIPSSWISERIPKLSGKRAVCAYGRVSQSVTKLEDTCTFLTYCHPSVATLEQYENCVFVSGTAYNYLNVFRLHQNLPAGRAPWSSSKILVLGFSDHALAHCSFAYLSSRLA
jgi:hypothetical protein